MMQIVYIWLLIISIIIIDSPVSVLKIVHPGSVWWIFLFQSELFILRDWSRAM